MSSVSWRTRKSGGIIQYMRLKYWIMVLDSHVSRWLRARKDGCLSWGKGASSLFLHCLLWFKFSSNWMIPTHNVEGDLLSLITHSNANYFWKCFHRHQFSSVQLLSCVWLFAMPWSAARQASLSITNSQSLLKLISIESVMPSNHLILCHPLLLPPSIFPCCCCCC